MSHDCNEKEVVLPSTFSDLNPLNEWALNLIRKHVFSNAQRVIENPLGCNLNIKNYHMTFPPSQRIVELDRVDMQANFHTTKPTTVGRFDHDTGKIFLVKNEWCVQTIIHETLHSCSITSRLPDLRERLRPVYEGLTEFFTGYILYQEHRKVFTNCWSPRDGDAKCSIKQDKGFRIWATFFNFVPIESVIAFYFQTEIVEWDKILELFIANIRKAGFNSFQDPFSSIFPMLDTFRQECMTNIGPQYSKIYNDYSVTIDFSKIRT